MVLRFMDKLVHKISRVVSHLLIVTITGLRPLLGPACCKFSVSCTDFAVLKLKEGPLYYALWEIIKRICRCQPFYRPKHTPDHRG